MSTTKEGGGSMGMCYERSLWVSGCGLFVVESTLAHEVDSTNAKQKIKQSSTSPVGSGIRTTIRWFFLLAAA